MPLAKQCFSTQVGVAEAQAGLGYELDVIAAAVIGGASLSGGRGSIVGAFLGACLLGVLRNAFILLALSPFLQQLSIGLVIVLDQISKLLGIHIDKAGFPRDLLPILQHLPSTSIAPWVAVSTRMCAASPTV